MMAKAKKHKNVPPEELAGDWRFTDATINEADGEYVNCLNLMQNEPHPWMLASDLTLIHQFGMANMRLEFYEDRHVRIIKFNTSMRDYVSNFDMRFLNSWCHENGWKKPEVSRYVVLEMKDFWKHMWQVNSVDSLYLEERYGRRPEDDISSGK